MSFERFWIQNPEGGKSNPTTNQGKGKYHKKPMTTQRKKQANRLKRGKNASYQVAIGFRFESHLLTGWRKFSGPITMRSKANPSNPGLSSTFSWKFLWEVLLPDRLLSVRKTQKRREGDTLTCINSPSDISSSVVIVVAPRVVDDMLEGLLTECFVGWGGVSSFWLTAGSFGSLGSSTLRWETAKKKQLDSFSLCKYTLNRSELPLSFLKGHD